MAISPIGYSQMAVNRAPVHFGTKPQIAPKPIQVPNEEKLSTGTKALGITLAWAIALAGLYLFGRKTTGMIGSSYSKNRNFIEKFKRPIFTRFIDATGKVIRNSKEKTGTLIRLVEGNRKTGNLVREYSTEIRKNRISKTIDCYNPKTGEFVSHKTLDFNNLGKENGKMELFSSVSIKNKGDKVVEIRKSGVDKIIDVVDKTTGKSVTRVYSGGKLVETTESQFTPKELAAYLSVFKPKKTPID